MADDDVLAALIEMGFPPQQCDEAVKANQGGGVQVAMDWILAQQTDEVGGTVATPAMQPKSLKCEDCGKILKNELDAQAHAARTGHQTFAESTEEVKPLSAKEKAAQISRLEEKMKQKRLAREEKEKKDDKEREMMRRKSGRELTEAKQKMEVAEMKRLAEERRREKAEDRMARQKVKEQIARDRDERAACDSKPVPQVTVDLSKEPITPNTKREYSTCRLQLRLIDGTATVKSFKVTDTLQQVVNQVGSENTKLMTSFPRRIFTDEDLGRTLQDLGLVPSAVLIQTMKKEN